MADEKSALASLFEQFQGRPVMLQLPHNTPLMHRPGPLQTPIEPGAGPQQKAKAIGSRMKPMSAEGEALMKLFQMLGADVDPADLHEDTDEVIKRLPGDKMLGGDIIT